VTKIFCTESILSKIAGREYKSQTQKIRVITEGWGSGLRFVRVMEGRGDPSGQDERIDGEKCPCKRE
jgi:hypothetical protein